MSWFKGIIFGIIIMLLASCSTYQLVPKDECCETEVVYLEDVKSGTTVFSTLDFKTITLDFRPGFYRSSDLYWYHNYGYMGSRPLWMDFNFHFGNYYSFYNPYYSFNRPWNYWDWYMRPWRPYQHNQWSWNNGPFNNQGYNVVYNASRRGSLIESNKIATIVKNNINNNRPLFNKPIVNSKPIIRNNSKPIIINNNNKPNYNNSRPNYNNNTNTKPSYNSRPSNNSRPSITVKSRGGKNN
jgi:hypothetical protein